MGETIFDQYTYLHFASGIIAYFWGITLKQFIILHLIFEILENSPSGVKFINKYLTFWPGGKPKSDSIINTLGDNIGSTLGWLSAYYLDQLGKKYKWYSPHLSNGKK